MDCLLRVGIVGINFKTADLAFREAIARSAEGLTGEAGLFFPHPAIVLSTCNRCEIYFSSEDLAEAHSDLLRFFRRELGGDDEHRFYSYFGIHCLSHLCRVAAGLDSAIVAETEIQRQVKCAYLSQSKTPLPSELHFLFQKALKVGKEIRTSCPKIQGGDTIFKVIWHLISEERIWDSAKILFVGNSQINRSLIRFLQRRGMQRAHLCTRYPGTEEDCEVFGRGILSSWEKYNLIFCASQSAEYLVRPKEGRIEDCMIFDLSVPRNVDPQVANMQGVRLFNIDQLDCLLKERGRKELDLFNLEEKVRSHALRLCCSYRNKISRSVGIAALLPT